MFTIKQVSKLNVKVFKKVNYIIYDISAIHSGYLKVYIVDYTVNISSMNRRGSRVPLNLIVIVLREKYL